MPIITKRVYVDAYSYLRRFNVKDKAAKAARKPAAKPRAPRKKKAAGYNFAVKSTGKHVYL